VQLPELVAYLALGPAADLLPDARGGLTKPGLTAPTYQLLNASQEIESSPSPRRLFAKQTRAIAKRGLRSPGMPFTCGDLG
jgi:hypothetical protein